MRREDLYLGDIVEAADAIARFLADASRDDFLASDLLQSAVLQKLVLIGEAAARLPAEFRSSHTAVDWRRIVAFRNVAVHAYFAIDWSIVWVIATSAVPALRTDVARIRSNDPP
jgi:uncharacterized protein with HEPN domain